MGKKKVSMAKSPSQLGSSLRRIQTALEEWEDLQSKSDADGHPADLRKKTKKLLRDIKDQIDELNL